MGGPEDDDWEKAVEPVLRPRRRKSWLSEG